jgi:hypothetical protein
VYPGGGNLTIEFLDTYTDPGGPYTSSLENVTVTIFRGSGTGVTAIHLEKLTATNQTRSHPVIFMGFLGLSGLLILLSKWIRRERQIVPNR